MQVSVDPHPALGPLGLEQTLPPQAQGPEWTADWLGLRLQRPSPPGTELD